MKVEKPKANTFLIRGLQWTTIIERMFYAESPQLRDSWLEAIRRVSDSLKRVDNDQDMMDVNQVPMAGNSYLERNAETTVDQAGKQQLEENHGSLENSANTQQMSVITLEHFEFIRVLGKGKLRWG
jgi:RAC serine/threonine-protein kinase